MMSRVQKRMFDILSVADSNDAVSRYVDLGLITLIVVNVVFVILETVEGIHRDFAAELHRFEIFSVVVFTIEYALRLWTAPCDARYRSRIRGRMRYAKTPLAVIDLLAILPFYLSTLVAVDLRMLRALRLFRMARIFKLGRYSSSLQTFGNVILARRDELLITFFCMALMVVFASSLLYLVEHDVQPDTFSSIPAAMWWGVATLTTVGYGDIYPVTAVGKFCGALIAIVGIAMFAIPAGVLASGFSEEMERRQQGRRCPHCAANLDERPTHGVARKPSSGDTREASPAEEVSV